MTVRKALVAGAAVAAFALAGQAEAQQKQQQLSEQEVQQFFQQAEQTMTRAVKKGDFAQVLDWAEKNIADEATFSASLDLVAGEERKGFVSVTLNKDDVVKLGGVFTGMLSGMHGDAIQDYSLQIEVTDVTPIGSDAAMVRTEITESGTLRMPQVTAAGSKGAAARQQQEQKQAAQPSGQPPRGQAGAQSAEFEAVADCTHLVRRAETGGDLMMGLTNCQGETRLGIGEPGQSK